MSKGNAGDSTGYRTNAKPDPRVVLDHFDALPPLARAAVRDAALDWDTIAISRAIARGRDPVTLKAYIDAFEREHLRRPE